MVLFQICTFLYCFADDGMFNRTAEFSCQNFLTFARSPMISIYKWKGRWQWQFSPAVTKIYPTAAPIL